jgi:CelD/BcsL family acetyltransferase involved in cellulose biosynthesis
MLSLDVARPSELGRAELDAWLGLQAARPDLQSPFLTPGWALAVERARGGGVKAALAQEDGRLRAVLAACVGRGTAWPVGAPLCDVQGLVAEPGFDADPRALVRALGVRRYDFSHMAAACSSFAPFVRGEQPSFVVDLTQGFAAWAEEKKAGGSGLGKDLAKRRRKLEREIGPTRFTAFSSDREDLAQLIAWKRRKFAETRQTDLFAAAWPSALVEQLIAGEVEGVRAGLFTLHAGDRLVAAHLHLLSATVVHGWLIAHDEAAEACSPGRLLFEDLLRWMDGRYRELDFGPVDYGFKARFANVQRPVGHGFTGAPSPAMLMRAAQYGVRRAAERLPLGRASAWPGKAMRRMDLLRALNAPAP